MVEDGSNVRCAERLSATIKCHLMVEEMESIEAFVHCVREKGSADT